MTPPKGGRVTKPTERRQHRIVEATRLRAIGHSYADIAEKLKVSESTAREDVKLGLQQAITDSAQIILQRELTLLDELTIRNAEIAFNKNCKPKTVFQATETLLKIMARRAKYLGLDNPTQIEVTDTASVLDRLLAESIKANGLDQPAPTPAEDTTNAN